MRNKILWYVKQVLPLTYRTTYGDKAGSHFVVWRMWFGRSFHITDVVVAPGAGGGAVSARQFTAAALAYDALADGANPHVSYVYADDLAQADDRVALPEGKCIRVTVEVVDVPESPVY